MHICNPSTHEKKARDSGIQGHLPLCSVFRVSLSYIEILSQTHICIRMHTHIRMHRHKSKKQNISIFEKMFLKISYSIFWTYFCPENLFLNLEKCLQGLGLLCLKARWVFFLIRRPFHSLYWSCFHENYYDSSPQSPCLL